MAGKSIELEAKIGTGEINSLLRQLETGGRAVALALNEALGGQVKKTVVIETKVDENGARKLVAVEKERLSAADAIINAQKQIDKVQRGSLTSLRQQVNEAKQARDGTKKYEQAVNGVAGRLKTLDPLWIAQNEKVRDLERQLRAVDGSGFWERVKGDLGVGGLINFANGLNQIVQGFQAVSIVVGQVQGSVNTLFQAVNKLQQIELTFVATGQGKSGGLQALNESSRIALNLGVSLGTVRESFQQLTPVITNSGGSLGDVSNIVETLSSRFAAYGISGDRARRVTNGIIQAFAKGKLQAEELTQQISEADPAFKSDFAQALRISVAELERWVKAGRVTTDVLLEIIPKLTKASVVYGKLGVTAKDAVSSLDAGNVTIEQVTSKLQSLGQLSLERLGKALEPFLNSLLRIGATVVDVVTDISKLSVIESIGSLLGTAGNQVSVLVETLLRTAQSVLIVVDAVNTLLRPLLSFPGVADIFSAAILAKVIQPLLGLRKALIASAGTTSVLGQALQGSFGGAFTKAISGITGSVGGLTQKKRELTTQLFKTQTTANNLRGRIGTLRTELDKYSRLAGQAASSSVAVGGGQAAALAAKYEARVKSLSSRINAYERILKQTEAAEAGRLGALNALNQASGRGAGVTTTIAGAFRGAAGAARGFFASLGPIGAALLAIGAITAGYSQANKESNAIAEESKSRLEALRIAQTEIGGSSASTQQSITGLALAFERFALLVDSAVGPVVRFFDTLSSRGKNSTASATKGANSLIDTIGRLALAAGGGAAAGAAIGAAFGGLPAGPGAIIGGLIGLLLGLASAGDDAGVQLEKLGKRLDATAQATSAESAAISVLIRELTKAAAANEKLDKAAKSGKGAGPSASDVAKVAAGYNKAVDAVSQLEKQQQAVQAQAESVRAEIEALGPAVQAVFRLRGLEERLVRLGGLYEAAFQSGDREQQLEIAKQIAATEAEIGAIQAQNPGATASEEQTRRYGELQNQLVKYNRALAALDPVVASARAKVGEFASRFGFLTTEQLKAARTTETVGTELKELEDVLEKTDPRLQAEKWKQLNASIAITRLELEELQNKAEGLQSVFQAEAIKIGIRDGSVVESISNVEKRLGLLDNSLTLVRVNAPELPGIIGDLVDAQEEVDAVNGKRAEITVSIIEERIGSGNTSLTLGTLDRYVESLGKLQISIPIDSPNADRVIQQVQRVQQFRDLGSKSSSELNRQLIENEKAGMEERYNLEQARIGIAREAFRTSADERKALIQAEAEAVSRSYDERIAKIRQEAEAVRAVADARIEGLQRATPAERALANLRDKKLRQTASGGETREERLAARAQLERDAKEKKIQAAQKKAAEEQARLQAVAKRLEEEKTEKERVAKEKQRQIDEQIRAAEKQARAEDIAFREKSLAYQEKMYQLAQKERREQSEAIQAILAGRENGGGGAAEGILGSKGELEAVLGSYAAVAAEVGKAATSGEQLGGRLSDSATAAEEASTMVSEQMLPALEASKNQVIAMGEELRKIDGLTVTVRINSVGSRWTGGPVRAGQSYTVNELGQEGFLSAGGRVGPINKPKNAMWRAPSSGTVIPAHIWAKMDVPKGGVQATSRPVAASTGAGGMGRIMRAIQGALGTTRPSDSVISELANLQAHQSTQIGRLSRAVDKLADKDWNLNVGVRHSGHASYLDAINRRL